MHINILELEAVSFGLKSLFGHLRQTDIKVLFDNTTAVCTINNISTCKSLLCDQEVKRIWSWATERHFYYCGSYPWNSKCRGRPAIKKSELRTECKLPESIFDYIQKYLNFYHSVNLFASRIKAQLP